MRCRLAASTDSATVRTKPSAPWLRTRSSPRCFNPLMADSIAGCARRAAAKVSLRLPLPVSPSLGFVGETLAISFSDSD